MDPLVPKAVVLGGEAPGQRDNLHADLERADDRELEKLLAALGAARPNPQYARTDVWREEG